MFALTPFPTLSVMITPKSFQFVSKCLLGLLANYCVKSACNAVLIKHVAVCSVCMVRTCNCWVTNQPTNPSPFPPHTHTHVCTHTCTHVCTHTCTHVCTHTHFSESTLIMWLFKNSTALSLYNNNANSSFSMKLQLSSQKDAFQPVSLCGL